MKASFSFPSFFLNSFFLISYYIVTPIDPVRSNPQIRVLQTTPSAYSNSLNSLFCGSSRKTPHSCCSLVEGNMSLPWEGLEAMSMKQWRKKWVSLNAVKWTEWNMLISGACSTDLLPFYLTLLSHFIWIHFTLAPSLHSFWSYFSADLQ